LSFDLDKVCEKSNLAKGHYGHISAFATHADGETCVGTSKGYLFALKGKRVSHVVKTARPRISAIHLESEYLILGGEDSKVYKVTRGEYNDIDDLF
jgi:hypothetical protein